MRLLVFGQTGQVAQELQRLAPQAVYLDRAGADLANPEDCAAAIRIHRPDAVINAAAYTAVDRAENEEVLATTVNGAAPGAMARECINLGVPLVHVSTDYVFDGSGTKAWQPEDLIAPLGAYGRSKLAGEQAVRAAGGTHAILRTSWVFSVHGNNFVKTMLRLSGEHDILRIVADQMGGPTPAADIAAACLSIVAQLRTDPGKTGTYHFSAAPDVSWAGFAREIFDQARCDVTVTDITTTQFPTPASRPANSRLDNTDTLVRFGIARPDWRAGLTDILAELGQVSP